MFCCSPLYFIFFFFSRESVCGSIAVPTFVLVEVSEMSCTSGYRFFSFTYFAVLAEVSLSP